MIQNQNLEIIEGDFKLGHEAIRVRSFHNHLKQIKNLNINNYKDYMNFQITCKVEWKPITDENGNFIKITESEINY